MIDSVIGLANEAKNDMPFALPANFYLATVVSSSGATRSKVRFNGVSGSTTKTIKSVASTTALPANAKVLVIEIGGTFLILARIP